MATNGQATGMGEALAGTIKDFKRAETSMSYFDKLKRREDESTAMTPGPTTGAGGAQKPTRDAKPDYAAKALAAQINHLNIAAQREITQYAACGDYRGAAVREDMLKEEIEDAIKTWIGQNRTAEAIQLQQALERIEELVAVLPMAPVYVPLGEIDGKAWERLKAVGRGYADSCPKCGGIMPDGMQHRCPVRNPDPVAHATTFDLEARKNEHATAVAEAIAKMPAVPPVELPAITLEEIRDYPGTPAIRTCSACGATDASASFNLFPNGRICDGCAF